MRARWVPLLAILTLAACGKSKPVTPDPTYDDPVVAMQDVDDSLASLITGARIRVPYQATSAIKGAAEPLVTIVEFSDFQCPFCGRFANTVDELMRVYPDEVRLVFMQYPLKMHPNARTGAQAAIAASEQGRFWAMHDRLFASRHKMDADDVVEHAKALGLDEAAFSASLVSEETEARLNDEQALGRALGVRGTPTFFINGRRAPQLTAELIDEERALANRLIEAGAERKAIYAHIMRAATSVSIPAPTP